MKLFKNNVGRPSNEILEKRRKFYVVTTILISITIISIISLAVLYFNGIIKGENKNAATNTCVMPYTRTKCSGKTNETVRKIQSMLTQLGHYKTSYGIDGKFGPKTQAAVRAFQKSQKITQDASVGPDTLERLAKATGTKYYKIVYNKNGGSGILKSQYKNTQVIINGISTNISSTKLTKSKKNHVGYTLTSTVNGVKYRFGCFSSNCTNGKAYKESELNGKTFYDIVYPIGIDVKNTGWVNGQSITFTAKYCDSGQTYNQKTSKCEKTTPTSGSYNKTAKLTGYGTDCCGNSGLVACSSYMPKKVKFSSNNYTYPDDTYGTLRVVAMKMSSKKKECGTVIEIESYKDGTSTKKAVKAIVLDTGVGSGVIDLMVKNQAYARANIGAQYNIKYKVLRTGF